MDEKTLEALRRILKGPKFNLEDHVYDVRERCGGDWQHHDVVQFSEDVTTLKIAAGLITPT